MQGQGGIHQINSIFNHKLAAKVIYNRNFASKLWEIYFKNNLKIKLLKKKSKVLFFNISACFQNTVRIKDRVYSEIK